MPTPERLDVTALRALLTAFRDAVHAHAPTLNLLNVYPVPDGDTGTNMSRTLDAVVDEMEGAAQDLTATCDAISHGSLMGARGNSGVILSQILRGIAATLRGDDGADGGTAEGPRFAAALQAATTGAYQAVMKPVEGTILTVVRESAEAAEVAATTGATLVDVVEAARVAAADALRRTPELLPVLRDAGVVDAGGAGFVLFFDAALHVLTGRPLPEPEAVAAPNVDVRDARSSGDTVQVSGVDGDLDVSEQRYEVMFLCAGEGRGVDAMKSTWTSIGDSIVVVGGDGLWNCHVHTNDVGAAIEAALDAEVRPSRIRVTDLFEEVADEHAQRDAAFGAGVAAPPSGEDTALGCAVVAVASGPGLARLFADLGVSGAVTGGQTSNPSTAELLDAVERAPAAAVVVLPNNKNIIAVAEQVDGLTAKSVTVVPTRTMPEGLAALVAYDPDADLDVNRSAMTAAAGAVVTGEVTRAVRDSTSAAGAVREGEWIGLVRGDGIVAVAGSPAAAAIGLLDRLLADHHEIVTVVTGADAPPDVTAAIEAWLADHHGDVEVEVHDGGQPLYPYLFGIE